MQISGVSSSYYLQQMQQSMFNKADADASGSISAEEFTAAGPDKSSGGAKSAAKAAELFSTLDGSGDGELSTEQFNALFSRLDAGTASSMMQFQQQPNLMEELFSRADEDEDGSLTLDEMIAAAPEELSDTEAAERAATMFEEMDTDGDGSVTQSEMRAFEETRRAEGGHMPPPPPMSETEESGTDTLADILAAALEEEDEASETGALGQLQAYLKQMQSGSGEESSLAARIFA